MPHIQCPANFIPLQQVTASNLNAHVNNATIQPGVITEQIDIASNTIASGDKFLIHDASASALRATTAGDILNSNLPVTASTITSKTLNAPANSDIFVTSNQGLTVSGKLFNSPAGTAVTITSNEHGLVAGQEITVTASNTAYSGTFRITSVTVNEIVYTLPTAATPSAGTCSYVKNANTIVNGNEIVTGNLTVDGNIKANTFSSGSSSFNGTSHFAGTANFTGTFQVGGTVGYVLYEISQETITPWAATIGGYNGGIWQSSLFTKPSDEIWVINVEYSHDGVLGYSYELAFRYASQAGRSGQYLHFVGMYDAGVTWIRSFRDNFSVVIPVGTAVTNERVAIDAFAGNGSQQRIAQTSLPNQGITNGFGGTTIPSVFRIYKYKTA